MEPNTTLARSQTDSSLAQQQGPTNDQDALQPAAVGSRTSGPTFDEGYHHHHLPADALTAEYHFHHGLDESEADAHPRTSSGSGSRTWPPKKVTKWVPPKPELHPSKMAAYRVRATTPSLARPMGCSKLACKQTCPNGHGLDANPVPEPPGSRKSIVGAPKTNCMQCSKPMQFKETRFSCHLCDHHICGKCAGGLRKWNPKHQMVACENDKKPKALREYFSRPESPGELKYNLSRSKRPWSTSLLESLSKNEWKRGSPEHPQTLSKLSADAELGISFNRHKHAGSMHDRDGEIRGWNNRWNTGTENYGHVLYKEHKTYFSQSSIFEEPKNQKAEANQMWRRQLEYEVEPGMWRSTRQKKPNPLGPIGMSRSTPL